jgi:hypothetical protein
MNNASSILLAALLLIGFGLGRFLDGAVGLVIQFSVLSYLIWKMKFIQTK